MQKKTVFLFLGLRIYMSDLLQTNYIQYLSEKYNVIVFMLAQEGITDPNKRYYKNDSITYILMDLPKSRFWMLFEVYIRNELIKKFDHIISVQWRNARAGDSRRLFLRRIMRFFPKGFSPRFIFRLGTWFVPGLAQFREYVKKYNPSLVLTATPGLQPFDVYAILCAKRTHISSVSIDTSWDNLTSIPRHIHNVDYIIFWNEWMKKIAIDLHGFKEDQVFVSGAPRFDHYFIQSPEEVDRETFLKSKGLDPRRKTVFFAARNYGGFFDAFIEAFIGWQKNNALGEPVNLFVRVHPLDSIEPYRPFMNTPNIHVEYGGKPKQDANKGGHKVEMNKHDYINAKLTLKYSDVCVSIASTMSLEAMIFGKPVINIGFAQEFSTILKFPHYVPVVESGAVKVAYSMDEVKEYLKEYLKNPSLNAQEQKKLLQLLISPTDGYAYKRNVDFLEEILRREAV